MQFTSDVQTRLANFSSLERGWYDGDDGETFDKQQLEWLASKLTEHLATNVPHLYPTVNGDVEAEWGFGNWCVSVEIELAKQVGYLNAINVETKEEREFDFQLATDQDWRKLADEINWISKR